MNKLLFNKTRLDRKISLSIIIAVVIIIVLLIILVKSLIGEKTIKEEEIKSRPSSSVSIEDGGYYGKDGNIEADVVIPHFTNLEDNFNRYINDLIKDKYDYKKAYKEFTAGMSNADALNFKYNVSYERYDFYDYVSIIVNEYAELEGNRPRKAKACYVIDAKNARTASLEDLFSKGQNYKTRIIEEVRKQAKEKNIELANEASISYLLDSQCFYIKDEKLHIFFEATSIAPNSYGDLDFEMPFEAKRGLFII